MKRQTVQADKAALKKEYHTVLQIMKKTLDQGKELGSPQDSNTRQNEQQQQLLSQFQSFGEHCLQRDSQYTQLKKEHQNLVAKYNKKVKQHKKLSKQFSQQSELLQKRQKEVYHLSMKKIKKTQNTEKNKKQRSSKQCHFNQVENETKIETEDKAAQSEQTFQRMDETIKRLNKQKQELKMQLQQSRSLYKDKALENQSLKILLQKLVEDRKINGPWSSNCQNDKQSSKNSGEEKYEQESIDESDQNLSSVQSYVSQRFNYDELQKNDQSKKQVIEQVLDEQSDIEIYEQKNENCDMQSSNVKIQDERQNAQFIKKQNNNEDENLNNMNAINKQTLLWKACIMVRNYIERFTQK